MKLTSKPVKPPKSLKRPSSVKRKKALREERQAKREALIEKRQRQLAKKGGWEHETVTDKTVTKDGESFDVHKHNRKKVKHHEDGKSWHRDYERSDTKGNHKKMTADGAHQARRWSVAIEIDRHGERTAPVRKPCSGTSRLQAP